ncbi:MAG: PadR family transcriptional regulator [Candidatus Aminicenantes bacterium]|nr:PadR family transcriptional regulator [Candidatus Aminicenantes bacterium]
MNEISKLDENVLLIILSLKDNAYIVTIKTKLEKYLNKNISLGTLYLSLKRLTRDGYIFTKIGEAVSKQGGRAKKYYRLTPSGVMKLKEIRRLHMLMWKNFDNLADKALENR